MRGAARRWRGGSDADVLPEELGIGHRSVGRLRASHRACASGASLETLEYEATCIVHQRLDQIADRKYLRRYPVRVDSGEGVGDSRHRGRIGEQPRGEAIPEGKIGGVGELHDLWRRGGVASVASLRGGRSAPAAASSSASATADPARRAVVRDEGIGGELSEELTGAVAGRGDLIEVHLLGGVGGWRNGGTWDN